MKDPKVHEIGIEISTLQSKLGLLRNELMRSTDQIDISGLRKKLASVESQIDQLQSQYQRVNSPM
jgi:uncharacterized protein involved in exopolysaccharide biosynthesis